jgi:hypothetical protein
VGECIALRGFAQRCSRKVQARRSPQLLTSCGLHPSRTIREAAGRTSAYQGSPSMPTGHGNRAVKERIESDGPPLRVPHPSQDAVALRSPPSILQRERQIAAIGHAT